MTQPVLLALETASPACSAALSINGEVVSRSEVGSNIHSQVLLQMVHDLFKQSGIQADQLDAVAVGQGPGSFTGLRIGIGVAQGIAYGAECPMVGISSLDALALQAPNDGVVLAGLDARMGEIYHAEYRKSADTLERLSALMVSPPSQIKPNSKEDSYQWLGNAWSEYQTEFDPDLSVVIPQGLNQQYPLAESLLILAAQAFAQGKTVSPTEFAPEYVRNDVAKKSVKK